MKAEKNSGGTQVNAVERTLMEIEHLMTKPGRCECGSEYEYKGLGHYECPRCRRRFLNEYGKVRDFVDEYGSAYSLLEIAEKTGVQKRLIDLFVKDKRFDLVKTKRRCKGCKEPIDKGTYCNKCALLQIKHEIHQGHGNIVGSGAKDADMDGKMHHFK